MRKLLAVVLITSWTIVLVALQPAFAQQMTDGHLIKPGTLPLTAVVPMSTQTIPCNATGGSASPTPCSAATINALLGASAFNPASPGAIGGITPGAGTFTALNATSSTTLGVLNAANVWTQPQNNSGGGWGTTAPIVWSGQTADSLATSGFYENVAVSGTSNCSQPCSTNKFVQNYTVNAGAGNLGENTQFYSQIGGGFTGRHFGVDITEILTSPSGNTGGQPYQALNAQMLFRSNDGGTSGSYSGTGFTEGLYCELNNGATFVGGCIIGEGDGTIDTGASGHVLGGWQFVLLSSNAVAPDQEGFGFMVGAQGGAVPTLKHAFEIGGYSGDIQGAIATTGDVLGCQMNGGINPCSSGGIANGINFHDMASITGCQFWGVGGNICIDGSGNVIAPEFRGISAIAKFYAPTTGAATLGNDTNGIGFRVDVDGGAGSTDYMNPHGIAAGNNFTEMFCLGADANVGCTFKTKGNAPFIAQIGSDGLAFEVPNAAGSTCYFCVTTSGSGLINMAGVTTTSAPSAGGGGALPATPTGYYTMQINGVSRELAYYLVDSDIEYGYVH